MIRAKRWLRWKLGPSGFSELDLVRRTLRRHRGLLVDVGAHRGESCYPFAKDGWQVIAFEPDPASRAVLEQAVRGLPVTVDPRAIAESEGEMTLYTSDVSSGISALAPFHPSHQASARVATVRLDKALAEVDEVTVLKTDLEGWDLVALRTFPWDRLRPLVVVCEYEDRKTGPLGYTMTDEIDFLQGLGYTVLVSSWAPIVEYGQQHEWLAVRRWPTHVDPAGWGNLIATDAPTADGLLAAV